MARAAHPLPRKDQKTPRGLRLYDVCRGVTEFWLSRGRGSGEGWTGAARVPLRPAECLALRHGLLAVQRTRARLDRPLNRR
jgi:hypothetical protein